MIRRRRRKDDAELVGNTVFRLPGAPAMRPGTRRPAVLILAAFAGLAALFAATV